MKNFKKLLVILLGTAMLLSMAACGSGEDGTEADADPNTVAYDKILGELNDADVETDGDLTVATSPDFAPLEFVDTSRSGDAQYVGFDMILAKYIANELGKNLVIKPMSFDAVIAGVQAGNVDLGISGFSWTQERAKNFYITEWYEAGSNADGQVVITTKENEGKFTTADSFKDLKVGAQGASLQALLVEEQLGMKPELYTELNEAVTALLTGKIDALACEQGNADSFISANKDTLALTGYEFDVADKYKNNVILVNKNNEELGKKVDEILLKFRDEVDGDSWYEAAQLLGNIKTIDELGYDENGNKITE